MRSPQFFKSISCFALAILLSGCPLETVNTLNTTKFGAGRLPESEGSVRIQNWLIEKLEVNFEGAMSGNGPGSFKQSYSGGVNILAVLPGTDLANEYIIMGAHYDHLGTNCFRASQSNEVCNGATDNATGVAALREIAEQIVDDEFVHRRTLVLALWDQEEQGLLGSQYYVNNPVFPLAQTVAYVNFDILGAKLLASLGDETFIIGSESGGTALSNAVKSADSSSSSNLDLRYLNAIFGHRQSDHTNFLAGGVPSVFFTDGTGGCYHTTKDNLDIVSFPKLDQQIAVASNLVRNLLNTSNTPSFTTAAISQQDAVALFNFVSAASADRNTFPAAVRLQYDSMVSTLRNLAQKPSGQFNNTDRNTLVSIATNVRVLLRENAPCVNFDNL